MKYGIINIPVADLRSKPEMLSERLSQVLFGTTIEIKTVKKNFSKIILPEGYVGWCYTAHISQIDFDSYEKYKAKKKRRIQLQSASVYDQSGNKQYPYNLYFGTELEVRIKSGAGVFSLPGRIKGKISASSFKVSPATMQQEVKRSQILACAKRFLGTPYLWGGITPAGIDCSGLVQIVYRFYGIELSRDSKDQRKCGEKINTDKIKSGDLLFFPGHVGFSLGKGRLIHASAYRGMVTIDSLNKSDQNYRKDLDRDFEFARRIRLCN